MAHRNRIHAEKVVERFKQMISPSGRQHIGANHFDELSLLIESAISAAVMDQMEETANKIEQVAHELRDNAERFDTQNSTTA